MWDLNSSFFQIQNSAYIHVWEKPIRYKLICDFIFYFIQKKIHLKASSILLIIGAIGAALLVCLKIYPLFVGIARSTLDPSESSTTTEDPANQGLTRPEVDLIVYLLELVSIPLQAYLICIISAIHELHVGQNRFKCSVVNFCAQSLLIANFIFWMNGSFLSFNVLHEIHWNREVYGKHVWAGLAQFILPLNLFFRFHSVHIILEWYVESWLPRRNTERRLQVLMPNPSDIPYQSLNWG